MAQIDLRHGHRVGRVRSYLLLARLHRCKGVWCTSVGEVRSLQLIGASLTSEIRIGGLEDDIATLRSDLADAGVGPVRLLRLSILVCSPSLLLFRLRVTSRRLIDAGEHVAVPADRCIVAHELLALAILVLLVWVVLLVWLLLPGLLPRKIGGEGPLGG